MEMDESRRWPRLRQSELRLRVAPKEANWENDSNQACRGNLGKSWFGRLELESG